MGEQANVWVVEHCVAYEGNWLMGIFTSQEKATEAVEKAVAKERGYYRRYTKNSDVFWSDRGDSIEIREVEVDSPIAS